MGSWGSSEETTKAWTRPRVIFAAVALVAAAHAALYAFAVPPWALEDEEQHVDYVLNLRDEHKPPHLDDLVDQDIVNSAVATDRWGSLGLVRPNAATASDRLDPARMGLEGYSYEAYQPPLYYTSLVPVAVAAGDRLLVLLYTARLFGALLLAMGSVLTAWLAGRWAGSERAAVAAWIGGLACGLLPANAEAAARVNNDFACAVLVTAGVACLVRVLEKPDSRWGLAAGLVFAAAILTKPGGIVGIGASVAVLGLLMAQGKLNLRVSAMLLAPQAVVAGMWSAVSHARYGVWNAATAVVDRRVRFPPMSWSTIADQALDRAATPYGTWQLGTGLTLGWLAFLVVGLVLLRTSPPARRGPPHRVQRRLGDAARGRLAQQQRAPQRVHCPVRGVRLPDAVGRGRRRLGAASPDRRFAEPARGRGGGRQRLPTGRLPAGLSAAGWLTCGISTGRLFTCW